MPAKDEFLEIFRTNITRDGADSLLNYLENKSDFFTAPASARYHGAYPGGLVDHSLNVYLAFYEPLDAMKICEIESRLGLGMEETAETIAVCTLLHDVCKANYYEPLEGGGYKVNDRFPFGHGEKSVLLIHRFMQLREIEALAIRWHMGPGNLSRDDERFYRQASRLTPLQSLIHAADTIASAIIERPAAKL